MFISGVNSLLLFIGSGRDNLQCRCILNDDEESIDQGFDVVAAHTDGGSGYVYVGIIPANINQALAMECEDKEFWKAAMLDELVNHKEIFGAFGPAVTMSSSF